MDTFAPPKPPSRDGALATTNFRSNAAQFGDGYEQSATDGPNYARRRDTWTWKYLTPAEADEIEGFFLGHGSHSPFLWTPPAESVERKWKIDGSFSRDRSRVITHQISVAFVERHDL